jgi:8-hydroxy-5-deazaflavin:NADPH oxidoreductase
VRGDRCSINDVAAPGDDIEAKQLVIDLINSIGVVAIDLGSLKTGGAMHEVGAPLSGLDLPFVRRLR